MAKLAQHVPQTIPPFDTFAVRRRPRNSVVEQHALNSGLDPIAARVLAQRPVDVSGGIRQFLCPDETSLTSPLLLADMDIAAERLAAAVITGERIGIETDYDVDGLGAHATFRLALTEVFQHPPDRVISYVGHRLTSGYGLNDQVVDQILSDKPRISILVTADNGSSDEPRIRRLKQAGIDVLVSDHHELTNGLAPESAYACINPQRKDCDYGDKAIAGGMVLWLLLVRTREILIDANHLPSSTDTLHRYLDFVACSTIADCVGLTSVNNRYVVQQGLKLLDQRTRPCWIAMLPMLKATQVTAETIAFGIGPRINARSRLDDPMAALHFLISKDEQTARQFALLLEEHNAQRQTVERRMVEKAITEALKQIQSGYQSLVILLPDGHPGVQGICCSRLVEKFGLPSMIFSPSGEDASLITGSARSIDELHIRDLLQSIACSAPDLITKFGGHKAAAGVTLRHEDFGVFREMFDREVKAIIGTKVLGPYKWSDGPLQDGELHLGSYNSLRALQPMGRGFEPPTFDDEFLIENAMPLGDGTHLRLNLRLHQQRVSAVWFRARKTAAAPIPVKIGSRTRLLYELDSNSYKGPPRLQLKICAQLA